MLRAEIAPGLQACFVKPLGQEVPPQELKTALSKLALSSIHVSCQYEVVVVVVPEVVIGSGSEVVVVDDCGGSSNGGSGSR